MKQVSIMPVYLRMQSNRVFLSFHIGQIRTDIAANHHGFFILSSVYFFSRYEAISTLSRAENRVVGLYLTVGFMNGAP